MIPKKLNIAFFGSPLIAVYALEELVAHAIVPSVVVTNPDRPQGRSHEMQPTPLKQWSLEHGFKVFQPESLEAPSSREFFTSNNFNLSLVVAYGAMMPRWLVELPTHKTLNLHPSLLPSLRGASPIRSALLQDMQQTGVTIMRLDEKMDHGPVLAQQQIIIEKPEWPMRGLQLDELLAREGGKLLASTIPLWIEGSLTAQEQDHSKATFTKKITKGDGELSIDPFALPTGSNAYEAYLKICAYDGWPGTYFMFDNRRIKINTASLIEERLSIQSVTPEGKKEIAFEQFLSSLKKD